MADVPKSKDSNPSVSEAEQQIPWYKSAVFYETHVKAFFDSNGDGVGDFDGLTSKLDYLQDLGITAIWILPFYPSPQKDDGYDIANYEEVNSSYGTLKDFKEFLREAHARGIKVVTELVLNHTSDQHPWFQASRRAEPRSATRNWYVWSDTPDKYKEARVIFKDFESSNWSWDPVANAYYWHRFYSSQPDLNFDNPATKKALFEIVAFWFRMGVDGLRLDAVPYLFEREGTNCENLPETHQLLKELRTYIDARFKDRMLLAEANQWPTDAVAYFGKGDECHMCFNFPLMPRLFMAIQMEDRFPVLDIMEQTPALPPGCQWGVFLRNHDELTLEMVTDEERDYMYRAYGRDKQARINLGIRRRLAPLLGNDRKKIELINLLLFTLPGTPIVYYGDEIGMGDNYYLGDRNGVRTPMQWNSDVNAGFSRANPQRLYLPVIIEPKYHYATVNVENQEDDPSSLLSWTKRLIAVRKRFKSLGSGTIDFLVPDNPKVIAFVRKFGDETLLFAANLSGRSQSAELDLSMLASTLPHEIFGGMDFPAISKEKYRLTFTPYGYYLFSLAAEAVVPVRESPRPIPELVVSRNLLELLRGRQRDRLEQIVLPRYLKASRWFSGKGREIDRTIVKDVVAVDSSPESSRRHLLFLVDVRYNEGLPDSFLLPVSYVQGDRLSEILKGDTQAIAAATIAKIAFRRRGGGVLIDAMYDPDFRQGFLKTILKRETFRGVLGSLTGVVSRVPPRPEKGASPKLDSSLGGADQSNSSVVFGDRFILKLIRKAEEGVNPEVELGEVLNNQEFPSSPRFYGYIRYALQEQEPITIAVLQQFIKNQGTAWSYFGQEYSNFVERASSYTAATPPPEVGAGASIVDDVDQPLSAQLTEVVGRGFLDLVKLLGRRTGEFHVALARERQNPDFVPEPFTQLYQAGVSQSMNSYANRVLNLASRSHITEEGAREALHAVLSNRRLLSSKFTVLREKRISALRTRVHGDYHLGQVLYTGNDFAIIDFEGEPGRSLNERRLKRSPMKDIAGMIRSFHYIASYDLLKSRPSAARLAINRPEAWARAWYTAVARTFLRSYLETVSVAQILPNDKESLRILFDAYMLEKAVYELEYEINNRPAMVLIPLRGILELLGVTVPARPDTPAPPSPSSSAAAGTGPSS